MKVQQFLEHHGIRQNPFVEEDAQTDPVFNRHCIDSTYHPTWDKIYGNPAVPSTSIVFGEKGSGKTALRLQIARHLEQYNRDHPQSRLFVIEYDDFNPFLDRFRDTLSSRRRRADRALAEWRLWDHIDAILALGVTKLVDGILAGQEATAPGGTSLDRHQARDLLLLAACYDQSSAETIKGRWHRLRRILRFPIWKAQWDTALGIGVTAAVIVLFFYLGTQGRWDLLVTPWPYLLSLAGWAPRLWRMARWFRQARAISRQIRVGNHDRGQLRQILMHFTAPQIAGQPLPNKERTDDRYELLVKLQGILRSLGYQGIIILVDRVDEPHLINGSAEQMRALLWSMLDNKFLKHPGLGFKLLLPIELSRFIEREEREFYERSRLDKQNMIPSLEWTGEALYDVANARIRACAADGASPSLPDLFEPAVTQQRLIEALRSLRVPRHLFKFMYRLLTAHCNAYTDDAPSWRISSERFESVLAVYRRDQDAFDRGVGVV
jgi:hypothetical protein